jgi:hypothetical protein
MNNNSGIKKTGFDMEKELFETVMNTYGDKDAGGINALIRCFQAMSVRFGAVYSRDTVHDMIDDAFDAVAFANPNENGPKTFNS